MSITDPSQLGDLLASPGFRSRANAIATKVSPFASEDVAAAGLAHAYEKGLAHLAAGHPLTESWLLTAVRNGAVEAVPNGSGVSRADARSIQQYEDDKALGRNVNLSGSALDAARALGKAELPARRDGIATRLEDVPSVDTPGLVPIHDGTASGWAESATLAKVPVWWTNTQRPRVSSLLEAENPRLAQRRIVVYELSRGLHETYTGEWWHGSGAIAEMLPEGSRCSRATVQNDLRLVDDLLNAAVEQKPTKAIYRSSSAPRPEVGPPRRCSSRETAR